MAIKIKEIKYGAKRNSNWATAWWDSDYYYYAGQGWGSAGSRYNWATCIKFSISETLGTDNQIKFILPTDTDRKNSTWISKDHTLTGFILTTPPSNRNFGTISKDILNTIPVAKIVDKDEKLLTNFKGQSGVIGYLIFKDFKPDLEINKDYYLYIYPTKLNSEIDFEAWTWWRGKTSSISAEIETKSTEDDNNGNGDDNGGTDNPTNPPQKIDDIKIFDGADWQQVESVWIFTDNDWKQVEQCQIYQNGNWTSLNQIEK